MAFDDTFIQERIEATKLQIVAYEDAITALSLGTVQQYSLDTGQTRTTVTKQQIGSIRLVLDGLYNRLATLEARLNGAGVHVRPAF